MLEGAVVLWPNGETYESLMRQRIDKGPSAFGSEKQNEPLDPSQCEFSEEWFEFFDEQQRDGEWWLLAEKTDAVKLSDCDLYGALDPSKGRRDRHGDPSALISVAAWPSRRLAAFNGRYQSFWVVDADIGWIHPHVQQERVFALHTYRHYHRYGVEAVQFQELFAEQIQLKSLEDPTVRTLRIAKLTPISDKKLRIQKLGPYIYSKRLKFSRAAKTLYDQLRYFPQHAHDDGPDGVELCLETIGEIGVVVVSDIGDPRMQDKGDKPGTAKTALERFAPGAVDVDRTLRCKTCTWFKEPGPGDPDGLCRLQGVGVHESAHACEAYEEKR